MKPIINHGIETTNQENKAKLPYMDHSVLEDCYTEEDGSLTFSFSSDEEALAEQTSP